MKKYLLGLITGLIIFGTISVIALNISANDISYGNGTVKDAIDDLYTKKQLSTISLIDTKNISGNKTTDYQFENDIDLGFVIITASNNEVNNSSYVASINSLSDGNYSILNDITNNGGSVTSTPVGHRSKVYIIYGIKSGTIMNISTRYVGTMQIFKIN